jgi:hypothetical protein
MADFPPINTPKDSILSRLPGTLPISVIPKYTDAHAFAKDFEPLLTALEPDHLIGDVVWRDTFALTGTLRTFYSQTTVFTVLKGLLESHAAHNFVLVPGSSRIIQIGPSAWVDTVHIFDTNGPGTLPTSCSLCLSLVLGDAGRWRIWVIKFILERLHGQDDVDILHPQSKDDIYPAKNASEMYDVVVVGGSQAGLSLGGHLQALNLSYVVLEKNGNVGDAWRLRYDSGGISYENLEK